MKKTKRILAFILCITLFIVPLPFSINALYISNDISVEPTIILGSARVGSDNGPCGHSLDDYTLYYGSIWEREEVGTRAVCWYKVYPTAGEECNICHYRMTWVIKEPQGHNFATAKPDGTPVGPCSTCGYDPAS
ncbi:MAG: hypothetical protein J6I50_07995 [Clostridia bacterium]|nr:hypothetical protein [Clostridia bacterium]